MNERIVSNPVKAPPYRRRLYYISGIAALLLVFIALHFFLKKNNPPKIITYLAESKTITPLVLPDSTLVYLNKGSEIQFPEHFSGPQRKVRVSGEVFFEVFHNSEQRFVVDLGGINLEVLGTSFYTNNAHNIVVSVISGSVRVYPVHSPDRHLTLAATERAVYDPTRGDLQKSNLTNLNFLAWKTGVLEFNQAPLIMALHAIADTYDLELKIEGNIEGQKITARFEGERISDILETLSMLFNLDIEQNGREIIIK